MNKVKTLTYMGLGLLAIAKIACSSPTCPLTGSNNEGGNGGGQNPGTKMDTIFYNMACGVAPETFTQGNKIFIGLPNPNCNNGGNNNDPQIGDGFGW